MGGLIRCCLISSLVVLVVTHNYVKPPSCPDDSIFLDQTPDQVNTTIFVEAEEECAKYCDDTDGCAAYNIEKRDVLRCELNRKRAGRFGEYLTTAPTWEYYDMRQEGDNHDTCEGLANELYEHGQMEMMDWGTPTYVQNRGSQRSWWGKDALDDSDRTYHTAGNWDSTSTLYEYPTEQDFIDNTNVISHSMPVTGRSSQYLVYDRKFWYRKHDERPIMVMDLDTDSIIGNITETSGYEWYYGPYSSQCQMDVGQHSGVDIEADEYGVWIIYGITFRHCFTVIQKIDHKELKVTWSKLYMFAYNEAGGGFMADGIYYMTDHYNHNPTYIRYQVNVKNDTWLHLSESYSKRKDFPIPDGIQAQVHYNPKDGYLYSTNNHRHYKYADTTVQFLLH